ncbi:MAG TPA: hypothetical protein DEF47_20805 [Herpetosiphon sp.]|uniref:Glutaredoxin 2 n=1 Tax=Herpetosiphon aurantiacus (strain ATCC 23779 / DSM 785 / 114-95) TaxID=316274 RepID=A9B6V2_HERA2|nr:hypothetical protein [Herpetosiphon sp.]ABX04411.1 hypothetical protein Haur_1768 [Herpetosiphon aurantiacus DSM 785]HBW52335.1 hypothetical protein [Herpetosiphon sp.]
MPSLKVANTVALSLARLVGDQVQVIYYDLDDPVVLHQHAERITYFAEEAWPYPLALFDDEILFVGGLQPLKLLAAVVEQLRRRGLNLA